MGLNYQCARRRAKFVACSRHIHSNKTRTRLSFPKQFVFMFLTWYRTCSSEAVIQFFLFPTSLEFSIIGIGHANYGPRKCGTLQREISLQSNPERESLIGSFRRWFPLSRNANEIRNSADKASGAYALWRLLGCGGGSTI